MEHSALVGGVTKSEFERWQIRRRLRELGIELGPRVDVAAVDFSLRASSGDVDQDGQVAGRAA